MLITPLPGVHRRNLLDDLTRTHTDVSNLYGGGPHTAQERLLTYLDWTSAATERLGWQISNEDINRLILTPRYEQLLNGVGRLGITHETERLTNNLVTLELRQRVSDFERAVKSLRDQIFRWSETAEFIMFDSSVYIKHENKLEEIDFAKTVGIPDQPMHLLVPMVVIDELDRLKESKDSNVRWRAGSSLAVLDSRLPDPTSPGVLQVRVLPAPGQGADVRHEVKVEILLDPPGYTRLPNDDEEIVDRALAVEPLAGRKVTLVTYDTNQSTRARAAGLKVKKLNKVYEEPQAKK